MAANTNPIFAGAPNSDISGATLTTANTAKDGTGTVSIVFTAGAFGGRVDYLKIRALGTNTATVLRVFLNNGSSTSVATNNKLITEMTIAATTLSEIAALADNLLPLGWIDGMVIKAGYRITVAIGTTVAAGLDVSGFGGDF